MADKATNGRYLDGRQTEGSVRLGYVSPATHQRMVAYAEAFGISRQELVIRAIDNFLLEWEEGIDWQPAPPDANL